MKKITALLLLTAISAAAAPLVDPQDNYWPVRPTRYETATGVVAVGSDAWLVDNEGWTYATPERIAVEAAAKAAAQAEAEAQAALPQTSATGYAVLDETGHWVELIPTGDSLPVIGVRVSNSPLTPEERALMKAERKAARDALKAAAKDKKLNDKGKIALLMKAVFGVEE